jgi:hypothetical protein
MLLFHFADRSDITLLVEELTFEYAGRWSSAAARSNKYELARLDQRRVVGGLLHEIFKQKL